MIDLSLIQKNQTIAVALSGGKDSMLLAKLMQELHRHSETPFELVFLVMDPGYNEENRRRIEENAKTSEAAFTTKDWNEYNQKYGNVEKTEIYTVLLNNRRLRNIDRNGSDLKITLN